MYPYSGALFNGMWGTFQLHTFERGTFKLHVFKLTKIYFASKLYENEHFLGLLQL